MVYIYIADHLTFAVPCIDIGVYIYGRSSLFYDTERVYASFKKFSAFVREILDLKGRDNCR